MPYDSYEALIGKRVVHSIMDAKGVLLIPEGTVLTNSHTKKLEKFQVDPFDIMVEEAADATGPEASAAEREPETAEAQPAPVVPAAPTANELVLKTETRLRDIERFVQTNGKVPFEELEENVLPVIMEVARKRNLFQLFAELKTMDDYRYKQSIGVAVMAVMLGKWLQLDGGELSLLATAASLYDIGSVKLPSDLLGKKARLQSGELEIMKEHTVLGHQLLMESGVDPRVALVALQHHERDDGSGYPRRLKGDQIDRLSKIVALADVYVAMTSERPYRPAYDFCEVIHEIHRGILQGRFDSKIGLTFLNGLMAAQIGSEVVLSDERRAKILLINPNYPTSPLVVLGDEFLDLSRTDAVKIKEVVG